MILILAGTYEARKLCELVSELDVTASLAGATAAPADLKVRTRLGGFGGDFGFLNFCKNNGVKAVVDATHPYAAKITERTFRLCSEISVPYLRLERSAWPIRKNWTAVPDVQAAIRAVPNGERVFLATGRQTLDEFRELSKAEVYVRVVDETESEFPFPKGRFIYGLPSRNVEEEKALFSLLGVRWLITKNSGGNDAKLQAADELGISVVLIERPSLGVGPIVETPAQAAAWIRAQCG